jgi:FMN reductase
MTARSIAVVSAGLSQPSSTRLLAERLATATRERLESDGLEVSLQFVELRDLAQDVTNSMLTGFAGPRLQGVIDTVTTADALIAVSPIFTASYSGLFKSFIDILDPQSLAGMPILIGATGGTERHSLALDHALRPLFSYLHAVVAPTGVYAASSDWGAEGSTLAERVTRAGGEFAALVKASDRSQLVRDSFALPAGFSPVGAFGAQ